MKSWKLKGGKTKSPNSWKGESGPDYSIMQGRKKVAYRTIVENKLEILENYTKNQETTRYKNGDWLMIIKFHVMDK